MTDRSAPRHRSSQNPAFAGAGHLVATLALAVAALSGCGSGNQPLSVVDPAAAPAHPTYTQAETILLRACAPCHRSSGGAAGTGGEQEDDLDYSSCAGITSVGSVEGVRRSVFERGDMPPGAWPRLDQREQLILERWIADEAKGPCKP